MNSTFTQQIIALDNSHQVQRALMDRREQILQAIGDRTAEPTKELLDELGELNIAIGDVPEAEFQEIDQAAPAPMTDQDWDELVAFRQANGLDDPDWEKDNPDWRPL